ncbi:cytochrome c [Rhizobiales bacterium]|uniref:c-type cytochrome n=1 Tax=Hongsoonwoonella zoysiae TaxID=2821844 RepID=UPI001561326C|nr:cytochrome c [Hongsoonwoonella zoysiae]NRG18127.1 cytochrome c [Hongsoonwoonella zoysiae]
MRWIAGSLVVLQFWLGALPANAEAKQKSNGETPGELVANIVTVPGKSDLQLGRQLAEDSCGRCHAVGEGGESPLTGAPAFRDLSKRYPVETLEEALAEGIITGHPDMPEFILQPDEIDAFIGYLKTIQTLN